MIRDVEKSVYVEGGFDFLLISKEQLLLQLRYPRSMIQIEEARLPSNGEIDGKPKKSQVYSPVRFVAVENGNARSGERLHLPERPDGPKWP